jgi:hypothetical protein
VRSLAAVLAVLIVIAAVAAGSAAAAPVAGSFAGAPAATVAHWTPARRAAAEPMSALPLTRAGTLAESPLLGASGTAGARETGSATTSVAPSGPIEGVDTGNPTLFPNRANGIVLGVFGEGPGKVEYQCSGSVVHSPAGDVVLTAGHCVIDAETGAVAREVIFVPGYRERVAPFGIWAASSWVTTPEWSSTAGTRDPDEAGDMAMLVLEPNANTGASVEATVGALSIAFEEPREQTYTQWGYPAEAPYPEGQILYSHTTPYAGVDPFYPRSVAPVRIASDFTAGASGGPWTIGPTSAPTVLSLTDYFYEFDPGHLYGAYFGSAARQVYETAAGVVVPPATTVSTEPAVPAASIPAPTPAATPPPAAPAPSPATGSLRILASHVRSTHGEATVVVHVGGPGTLRLSGAAVRTDSVATDLAGNYRLPVSAKVGSAAARALRLRGSATVGIWIRFTSPVGVRHASRLVRLVAPRD